MRKSAVWTALVVAVLFAAGTVLAAPPDKVVLKGSKDAKKPAVSFTHKAHTEKVKACADCHHKDAAGAEQKCSKCHGDKTEGKTLSAKEAFHAQCKDCHVKEKKGPTKCDDCHKK